MWRGIIIISIIITLAVPVVHGQLNVQYFLNKGINEFYREQYIDAIFTFNTLIRSRPDLAEPHIWRGRAKLSLGDYRGAEFDFTRAVMLDSYNPEAYYYRGVVKSNLYDYHSALKDYEKSLERRPNNPEVFFSRGTTRLRMKDYMAAIHDYDTLLLLRPDIEEAFLNRALAKANLERYDDAIKDCNQAIRLNNFYIEAFIQRGLFRNETGNYQEAMEDFDQAIKLDENKPLAWFYRAAASIKTGDTLQAFNDFNNVLRLDPDNDLTLYNRALIYLQWEQYAEARDDLRAVLALNPVNLYTWYNLGITNMRLENYEEAKGNFTAAIEIFPDFAAGYMSRAAAWQEIGNSEQARDDYETAIAIINAVNSGEDYGQINSNYSADSAYLQKIIEFEADFNASNGADGKIQNQRVLIQLMPNFSIQFIATDEIIAARRKTGYHYPPLDTLRTSVKNIGAGISAKPYTLSENAIRRLDQVTDSVSWFNPFDANNYLIIGIYNAMMMNYNEALTAFDRAIELRPDFEAALFNRANVRFELIEHQFSMAQSAPQITITPLQPTGTATDQQPDLPDFASVADDFSRVISLDPKMSFAWYNRGNIKNRMRNFEGALNDYSQALSLNPDFAEAYYNRALTLIYLGRTADACYDLSKAGELGVQEAYNVIKRYCR
jgi:tetratricopeptide (TPR) repeat protein